MLDYKTPYIATSMQMHTLIATAPLPSNYIKRAF